jgi:hypothetical protein
MTVLCAPPEHSVEEWAQIVRGEYEASPGLSLTLPQVRRLWAMDAAVCDAVLDQLTKTGFLRQNPRHMFVRHDSWL